MNAQTAGYIAETAALLAARAIHRELNQGTHVAARDAMELHKLSTWLHRIAENHCNYDLTCSTCGGDGIIPDGRTCHACAGTGSSDGRKETRYEKKCREIATKYGMRFYHQGDPRGAAVYLIPEESQDAKQDASSYNRGHAVCHVR